MPATSKSETMEAETSPPPSAFPQQTADTGWTGKGALGGLPPLSKLQPSTSLEFDSALPGQRGVLGGLGWAVPPVPPAPPPHLT